MEIFVNTLKWETVADLGAMDKPDYNNLSAWMDIMTMHFYPGKGENSPIVYTTRHDFEDQMFENIHYDTNLYTGKWVEENPEPKNPYDIARTAHSSLGADVQNCTPPPDFAQWDCT